MSELGSNISEDFIFSRVGEVMTRLKQNQKLQALAKDNGLDVKNTVQYTEDTINNIVVMIVALTLAQQENDPDYTALKAAGLSHRGIKTRLINKYKNQANQLITAYKNRLRDADTSAV